MLKINILAISLFVITFLQAQDSSKTKSLIYLNYKIIDELSVGIEKKINDNFSISMDIGYNFGGRDRVYVDNGLLIYPKFIFMQLADYGIATNLNFNLFRRYKHIWSLNYFYRDLQSNNLIEDPGKYAGSNTSLYAEYNLISKEHGLLLSYSYVFSPSSLIYFGVGAQMAHIEKHYFIYGEYSDKRPSNKVSISKEYTPLIKIGIRYILLNF